MISETRRWIQWILLNRETQFSKPILILSRNFFGTCGHIIKFYSLARMFLSHVSRLYTAQIFALYFSFKSGEGGECRRKVHVSTRDDCYPTALWRKKRRDLQMKSRALNERARFGIQINTKIGHGTLLKRVARRKKGTDKFSFRAYSWDILSAKQMLPRTRHLRESSYPWKGWRAMRGIARLLGGKRLCRLRRVSIINFTNIQSAFLECSRSLCRPRNASLDGLKARKRIGPRVNEVLTINDGATGWISFRSVQDNFAILSFVCDMRIMNILYYLYDVH